MWNPGFDFADSQYAKLFGYHRKLCLWSVRYRGSQAVPGLVLGLDRGGSCHGRAFLVPQSHQEETMAYLYDREMVNDAYRPVIKQLYLQDGNKVNALTFVSRRNHPQYARNLSPQQMANIIGRAKGPKGPNKEYVLNTAAELEQCGINDRELSLVARLLRK